MLAMGNEPRRILRKGLEGCVGFFKKRVAEGPGGSKRVGERLLIPESSWVDMNAHLRGESGDGRLLERIYYVILQVGDTGDRS